MQNTKIYKDSDNWWIISFKDKEIGFFSTHKEAIDSLEEPTYKNWNY